MEISPFIIAFVVAIFSVVQSLFGVGLLVFGTPTFLLLGASYPETIGYLLPSSLLISAIQSHGFRDKIRIARGIVFYSVPFVFLGMLFTVKSSQNSLIITIVGIVMLLISLIRIIGMDKMFEKIKKFDRVALITTGMIHGVSNQGGALLTILMGSIYSDKEKIRTNIAFAYLLFGLSQLIVLLTVRIETLSWMSLVYVFVTLVIYQFVGKSIFNHVNIRSFNGIFTGFILIYGILLLSVK